MWGRRQIGAGDCGTSRDTRCGARVEELEGRRLLSAGPGSVLIAGHLEGVGGLWGSGVLAVVRGKGLPTAASAYQVKVDWGDGSAADTSAAVTPLGNNAVALSGSHHFARAGLYHVTVTASKSGTPLGTVHETVRVSDRSSAARLIRATAGDIFNGVLGTTPVPPTPTASFRIAWNDGSPGWAIVTRRGGRYVISDGDNHTLFTAGQFSLPITELVPAAENTSGADEELTLLIARTDVKPAGPFSSRTIHAIPLPQTPLTAGQKVGVPLAELRGLPASLSEATASVHWGDGTPDDSTIAGRDLNGNMHAEIDHSYDRPGVYRAVTTFRAGNQLLGRTTTRITVLKNTPGGLDLTAVVGMPFQGVVATLRTIPAPQTIAIDWGDGTQSAGDFVAIGNDEYRVSGSHTYAAAGTYRVRVDGTPPVPGGISAASAPADVAAVFVGGQTIVFSTMQVSAPTS